MTPEQQRIAIAEACGWVKIDSYVSIQDGSEVLWWRFNGDPETDCTNKELPDYPNDLNAMHDAEKVLTGDQWSIYWENVQRLARLENTITDKVWREISPSYLVDCFAVHSTATQRAEAFIRTIGKWS